MAATTISARSGISSRVAGNAEELRATFTEHGQELEWLAEFLTGDEIMASACVIEASTLREGENAKSQEWLWPWPREATIRATLDLQRMRIAQLSSAYDHHGCMYEQHAAPPLDIDTLEFLVRESDQIRLRLDSICRFVLVLRGIENRCPRQVALLLGISEHAVEAAYCAALQSIDAIQCQAIVESYGYPAAYN